MGDPTEGALQVAAQKAGLIWKNASDHSPRMDVIPFESQRQYMATLHHRTDDSLKVVYMKGAMEKVLSLCTQELDSDGRKRPCDLDTIHRSAHTLGERGLRLLGLAQGTVSAETDKLDADQHLSGLTWLGLPRHDGPSSPRGHSSRASLSECRDRSQNDYR